MRLLLLILFTGFNVITMAQMQSLYVAAKNGLSIREKPDPSARVLDKIPYGQKVDVNPDDQQFGQVSVEGFNAWWNRVTFNNKTGYIVSAYLLPFQPPKNGIKDLKEYIAQLTEPIGAPTVLKYGKNNEDGFGETMLTKQYFKNGAEWHDYQGYEYNSFSAIIPELRVQGAWLLLRLLNCYPELVTSNEAFPVKNANLTKKITVERETFTPSNFYIKKIKIEAESGAIYNLEIFELDNQTVIYFNAGV